MLQGIHSDRLLTLEPKIMPSFKTTRRVKHSAQNMYDLVADIESYPQFVPLCDALVIRSRENSDNGQVLMADMTVAYKILRETFRSKVQMNAEAAEITTEAVQGPFRNMKNTWKFISVDENSCDVEFSISYEFRTFALQMLVGGLFDKVFRKFSGAFETRADEIYGTSPRGGAIT